MKLQTEVLLEQHKDNQIDYHSKVVLLGSCFADNIGDKLNYFKFQNMVNPFGILFNPKAIENLIDSAVNGKTYTEKDIFYHNEQWHCFNAHSKLSAPLKDDLLLKLNKQIALTNQQIKNSTHIIITLGTAWVYKHIETNTIVANCHKIPQKQFKKQLLSVSEIENSLSIIINLIRTVNTKAEILFTVSPVRHLKDGFVENQRSKAHLITAIHNVISNEVNKSHYFPSYEIMMDELRDYRFYKEDMIHPNSTAVQYIWNQFKHVWVANSVYKVMDEIDTIQKGLAHKPFSPNSEAHQKFLKKLETKIKTLQGKFPEMSF